MYRTYRTYRMYTNRHERTRTERTYPSTWAAFFYLILQCQTVRSSPANQRAYFRITKYCK